MRFWLLIVISMVNFSVFCQKIDTTFYQLDTSIYQNRTRFEFWVGSSDSTYHQLLILRIVCSDTSILYNDAVRDGLYSVEDVNGDGFADFSTFYHDYQQVYMFDTKQNAFDSISAGWLPGEITTLSKRRKLYFGFYDAMYGHEYPSSTLYTFRNTEVVFLYRLIFVTKGEGADMSTLKRIKVYKIIKGKPDLLINTINIKYPGKFDVDRFQMNCYKKLLHLN